MNVKIVAGEEMKPGDIVFFDPKDYKLRKCSQDAIGSFRLPHNVTFDYSKGEVSMPFRPLMLLSTD